MPYNYLLDGEISSKMKFIIENSILIFDEAHNIESVCEDGASFELSIIDLEDCEKDKWILLKRLKEEGCRISYYHINIVMASIQALKINFIDWKQLLEAKIIARKSHGYCI